MTSGNVSARVIGRRLKMIEGLLRQIRALPLVHFYYEVAEEELYRICAQELGDIERVADAFRRWVKQHPDKMEQV